MNTIRKNSLEANNRRGRTPHQAGIIDLLSGLKKSPENSFSDRNQGRVLEYYISGPIEEAG